MSEIKRIDTDWKAIPVYRASVTTARENHELAAFRNSDKANKACAKAVEQAIAEGWDGARIKEDAVIPVLDAFGADRLRFILANTLQLRSYDGRFSRDNRAWAQMAQPPSILEAISQERRIAWEISSHSVKLNDFVEKARQALEAMEIRDTPVYRESLQYAVDHDEKNFYFDSHRCNVECRRAIEKAISDHFDGLSLQQDAPNAVLQRFGEERTLYVLANTIQLMRDDGRVSRNNIQWADQTFIPCGTKVDDQMRREFLIREHPGLFDLFTKITRKTVQKAHDSQTQQQAARSETEQPSILEKLEKPAVSSPVRGIAPPKKDQVL